MGAIFKGSQAAVYLKIIQNLNKICKKKTVLCKPHEAPKPPVVHIWTTNCKLFQKLGVKLPKCLISDIFVELEPIEFNKDIKNKNRCNELALIVRP